MNLSGGLAGVVGRTLPPSPCGYGEAGRVSRRWNRTCGSAGRLALPVHGPQLTSIFWKCFLSLNRFLSEVSGPLLECGGKAQRRPRFG